MTDTHTHTKKTWLTVKKVRRQHNKSQETRQTCHFDFSRRQLPNIGFMTKDDRDPGPELEKC